MNLSIITPTYNRANMLKDLYESIIKNLELNKDKKLYVEWLVMDDGSTDNTEELILDMVKENKLKIKYHKQKNSGKMSAINSIIQYAEGDLIVECDSDDKFSSNAFTDIIDAYEQNKDRKDLYGLCFLKYDLNEKNIGNNFKKEETTMFDLYFKEEEYGEKSIVFFANVRKKYQYKIEKNEKFSTEARMYHEMDLKYKIKCFNKAIMICDYKEDGYTKNIKKIFKENPYGYFEYFKEILEQHNMKGVSTQKRLYVIKHYILFATLTKRKKIIRDTKGIINKFLILVLLLPGKIITNIKFK